jgi:thiopeptide-type bacteriocin biosynthesis protein
MPAHTPKVAARPRASFVALRTPLLPFDELLRWSDGLEAPHADPDDAAALARALAADRERLRERLRQMVERPEVREALFVASAGLHERLGAGPIDPSTRRGLRLERTLIRYLSRMAGRATPFGLFSGCSVGEVGPQTELCLPPRGEYRRHARLDMGYLSTLAERLNADHAVRAHLLYRPNTSLYTAGGRLHLMEGHTLNASRTYRLVAFDSDAYLERAIATAAGGAKLDAVAAALVDDEITLEEATEFVHELIDSQILVSDLHPAVTGDEPIRGLLKTLRRCPPAAVAVAELEKADALLHAMDTTPLGAGHTSYLEIAAALGDGAAGHDPSRLVQVDMTKPAPGLALGADAAEEVARCVELLERIPGTFDPFHKFRESFTERYDLREVPLLEALDDEVGIGFKSSGMPEAESRQRDTLRTRWLCEALSRGERELVIPHAELERLPSPRRGSVPGAFGAMASIAASSPEALRAGDYRIVLGGVHGPSGAMMLGRFCHADPELSARVAEHLRAEEAHSPEAVFAEVVHHPEGRVGNVLCRPILRDRQIRFLGHSDAPPENDLSLADLRVSVRGDRVLLRSASLGREVVPRLSSAHNYSSTRNLPAYQFLCALQRQRTPMGMWEWGSLASLPFLPRVRVGRVIVSAARWTLDAGELRALTAGDADSRFAAVQRLRHEKRLPRFVQVADGDNRLTVDLDNVLSVEVFADLVEGRGSATLMEMCPAPDELVAYGPEGRFVHELVIPFVRPLSPEEAPRPGRVAAPAARRTLPPGSEWLYAKLYLGPAAADRVVRDVIAPAAAAAVAGGAADRWFFIRYSDPHPHLRIRFHGHPSALRGRVLPALEAAAARLLADGTAWRFQTDTYEREMERYGDREAVELAEELFFRDSEAVAALLAAYPGEEGNERRLYLALRGADTLLSDFGMDSAAKVELLRALTDSSPAARKRTSARYRQIKHQVAEALAQPEPWSAEVLPEVEILRARSARLAPTAARLLELERDGSLDPPLPRLLQSYLHMHVNRLVRMPAMDTERTVYELLARYHESHMARQRTAPSL